MAASSITSADPIRPAARRGLPSIEVVIAECRRYPEILGGTLEIDVRTLEEPDGI